MNDYISLNDFKNKNKISDNNGGKISYIFRKLFDQYHQDEDLNALFQKQDKKKVKKEEILEKLLDELLEECKEVNPTLIPYEDITNIIFAEYNSNSTEFPFTENLKSDYEKRIIQKFSKQITSEEKKTPKSSDDLFDYSASLTKQKLFITEEYKNSILVIYKIIQHAELAVTQKQSLYEDLEIQVDSLHSQVDSLDSNVHEATNQYDNMMSNFISILGIFAAIMMATFGAVQGFSAIYSNENDYNFTTIILISSFGLFSLISILYILLYSISKLVDKEFGNDTYYQATVFGKYPVYSHTMLAISIISSLALTHLIKVNPPDYFPAHLVENIWGYTIIFIILVILLYYSHILVSQSSGYWLLNRHLSNYIMSTKNKLGLEKTLNIIIIIIISLIVGLIFFILYNIFK